MKKVFILGLGLLSFYVSASEFSEQDLIELGKKKSGLKSHCQHLFHRKNLFLILVTIHLLEVEMFALKSLEERMTELQWI